jgi:signal transduction histidine kinase
VRLFFRLQLAVFTLMAVLLVTFGWAQVAREKDLFVSDTMSDNRTIARWLSLAASRAWADGGEPGVESFIAAANAGSSGARAKIAPLSPGQAVERGISATVERDAAGSETVVVRAPILIEAQPVAVLEVDESMMARDAYVNRSIWRQVEFGCGLMISAILLSAVLGYYLVGRPVGRIVRRARLAGQGDLSSRLAPTGHDELGQIGRAIDGMCQQIEAAQSSERNATRSQILAMEQLRHAERLVVVGALSTGIAHELGTPLNVVQIRAGAIERREEIGDEAIVSARIIGEQTARMARIIRDLLDFARPRVPERTPTDLVALGQRTMELLRPIARKHGVTLTASSAREPAVTALVDSAQIEQVVSNLLMNAIQAQYSVGCVPCVSLSVDEVLADPIRRGVSKRYGRLIVQDNGRGIPADLLARIFEPFVTTKPAGQGTGLGLTVSESLVREHGGWIFAESRVDKGSTFTVYLPSEGKEVGISQ